MPCEGEAVSRHGALLVGMDLEELRGLAHEVTARIEALKAQRRQEALELLEQRATELGLTAAEVRAYFGSSARNGASGSPKYRHPESGETWSGIGRKPNWLKAYERRGGQLEALAI